MTYISKLSQNPSPGRVHSISWSYDEKKFGKKNVQRFNVEACKLGVRGVTIVAASGDHGVSGAAAPRDCGYNPIFPASSPYVVAVGGTRGPEKFNPEIACSTANGGVITTGGGFSVFTSRPYYQSNAVNGYLNVTKPSDVASFSSGGRAYPDVSALADLYGIVVNREIVLASGTSASAPVFAGMLNLINQARKEANKPFLGFVHPALYAAPSKVWNDITVGSNNCRADSSAKCCKQGFKAIPGWDPVTGLGSPKYTPLKEYLLR
eukprot:TRINITY_DN13443_c0_g1_i1.p1 TRINITY_DN13443_c0_g1~~TRINITY_DN13443_c0_g1_i1.p1  ORF type:complete len:264 (-),score=44.63 TRINITY_DN13443_c0_g1_i1:106-897(-)